MADIKDSRQQFEHTKVGVVITVKNRKIVNKRYVKSIHFMASTSLILPKYRSVVERFECRNIIFETISIGTPERDAYVAA